MDINTLYLTDPLEALQKLERRSIDLVIADPSALLPVQSALPRPANRRRGRRSASAQRPRFNPAPLLEETRRVLKVYNAFFFTTKALLPAYIAFAQQHGYAWDLIIWEHGAPVNELQPTCDFIITIWERGAYFNPDLKQSFFQKVKYHTVGKLRASPELPSEKPRKLVREFILQRSRPGDLVLDPFAGAGSVAVAARESGRNFIAFEGNPKWYAVAKQNLERSYQRLPGNNDTNNGQLRINYG